MEDEDKQNSTILYHLEWIFTLMMVFSGGWFFMDPDPTPAQIIFRLMVGCVGVVGVVVIKIINYNKKKLGE